MTCSKVCLPRWCSRRAVICALLAIVVFPVFRSTFGQSAVDVLALRSKSVVAVGETFFIDLEAFYPAPKDPAKDAVAESILRGSLASRSGVFEVVRAEDPRIDTFENGEGGASVNRLTRRLAVRSLRAGRVQIPLFEWSQDGRVQRVEPGWVQVYKPSPELHGSRDAIVPIFVERRDPVTRRKVKRTGTAFFVAEDALVTSYHVIFDSRRVYLNLPNGQWVSTDQVWSVDPIRDVAVLSVEPRWAAEAKISPLPLRSIPDSPRHGQSDDRAVFTYGWPGGLRHSTAGIRFDGATLGYDRAWVSSNAVGPGDSGGPLLDSRGEVIGVVTLGTLLDPRPDVLRETVCIANDPRPAVGLINSALGPRSLKSMFSDSSFRRRPYVQAFRLLAMIGSGERFDTALQAELEAFETSMATRSLDPGLHFFRGVLYRMLGTNRVADSSFTQVLSLFEDYFPAAYLIGVERFRDGNLAEAVSYFERTMQAEPYRNVAKYGLARTLMKLHRYERAATLLQEVLAHDPEYAPAIYHLALCRLAMGDRRGSNLARARLGLISQTWQRELDRVLRNSFLHPRNLRELPRQPIRVAKPL